MLNTIHEQALLSGFNNSMENIETNLKSYNELLCKNNKKRDFCITFFTLSFLWHLEDQLLVDQNLYSQIEGTCSTIQFQLRYLDDKNLSNLNKKLEIHGLFFNISHVGFNHSQLSKNNLLEIYCFDIGIVLNNYKINLLTHNKKKKNLVYLKFLNLYSLNLLFEPNVFIGILDCQNELFLRLGSGINFIFNISNIGFLFGIKIFYIFYKIYGKNTEFYFPMNIECIKNMDFLNLFKINNKIYFNWFFGIRFIL